MKREKPLVRLLNLIVNHSHVISSALIALAFLGILALPFLDRPIRFDEKGLQAGAAHPTIGSAAGTILPAAKRIAASAASASSFQHPGAPAALVEELQRAGLTATQLTRATVTAPGAFPGAPPTLCNCTNIHTLVRAPRGDGQESLALVTPIAFAPQGPLAALSNLTQAADAAELALLTGASLALHLANGPAAAGGGAPAAEAGTTPRPKLGRWLARDLIWVIPDWSCGPHQCLAAWVRMYHGGGAAEGPLQGLGGRRRSGRQQSRSRGNSKSPLPAAEAAEAEAEEGPAAEGVAAEGPQQQAPGGGMVEEGFTWMARGGVIQQAVVLEALAGSSFDTPELLVIGHEGLLPKLDMFYLLRYLMYHPYPTALWCDDEVAAAHRMVTSGLQQLLPRKTVLALDSYVRRLLTGLHFSWHQAVGQPTGSHAAFKHNMVDAATVRLVQRRPGGRARLDVPSLAVALASGLELSLRCLNNLVERVHHSSFLYVLTGMDRYVSVERYVGPAVALAAVLQLQAARSMLVAQSALPTTPVAGGGTTGPSPAHTWAVAGARAAARTAFLAASAAALRTLACDPWVTATGDWIAAATAKDGGDSTTCSTAVPPLVARMVGAAQSMLGAPLASVEGALVAACVLFVAVVGGASAAARLAGRLAAVAAATVQHSGGGKGSGRVSGSRRQGASGRAQQGGRGEKQVEEGGLAGIAAWHAERTIVLTMTAAAMAMLVCLNWAAAVVAGAYLAPLALVQGLGSTRGRAADAAPRRLGAASGGYAALKASAVVGWMAAMPLLLLASDGESGMPTGTIASALCMLSPTNYWYAHVVTLSFWLFGLEGLIVSM